MARTGCHLNEVLCAPDIYVWDWSKFPYTMTPDIYVWD